MKNIIIFILSNVLLSYNIEPNLHKNNWNINTYETLNKLIIENGRKSPGYNPQCRPYAVFDFDNTSIEGDITLTTMTYMIENLRFKIEPSKLFEILVKDLGDIDRNFTYDGITDISIRRLALDICKDYNFLYTNYISLYSKKNKRAFEKIKKSPEYQDFRARLWVMNNIIYLHYDYEASCLFPLKLFSEMTSTEKDNLVREAASFNFSKGKPYTELWSATQTGNKGKIEVSVPKGLSISKELKDLYKTLKYNGFDIYICSASEERIVEVIATDPKYGLSIDKEHVYGLRLISTTDGKITACFDKTYIQTYNEGKTKAIMKYIAPSHCGKVPVLVAGDSNGDYSMLTELKGMQVGLIINCNSGGNIRKLVIKAVSDTSKQTYPKYLVQNPSPSILSSSPTF